MTDLISQKVEDFFTRFKLLNYKKGEILFRTEDNPPGVYYLQKGYVRQYIISTDGNELTLHIYEPGSYFPMMWVIADITNNYFFSALTQIVVWRAPKEKVLEFLNTEPTVLTNSIKRLYCGVEGLLKRIEYLSFNNAYIRVIAVLLYLARHFGKRMGNKVNILYNFTHSDIAAIVGTARETTTREIELLIKNRLLIYENHSIIIPNLRRLEKELRAKK